MSAPPLFHLSRDGESVTGPHAAGYLRQGLESGELTLDTLACLDGTQDWLPMRELAAEIGIPKPRPVQPDRSSRKAGWLIGGVLALLLAAVIASAVPYESKEAKARRASKENLAKLEKDLALSKVAADIDRKVREYVELMESGKLDPLGFKDSNRKWKRDEISRKKDEISREYIRGRINFAEKEILLRAIDDDEKKEEEEEKRKPLEAAERYRKQLEKEEEERKERIEQWNKENPDFIRTYP